MEMSTSTALVPVKRTPAKASKAAPAVKPAQVVKTKEATKAAPAPKAEPVKKVKRVTVSSKARELILAGKTDKETFAILDRMFQIGEVKKHYPRWYRNELQRKGLLARVQKDTVL